MSRSIKFKNNNYLDSSSIIHNRELLSDILNIKTISLYVNEDYVYLGDLQYMCVKIGKLVILNIRTLAFKQEIPNYQEIIYGLPRPSEYTIVYLYGGNGASGHTMRLGISDNGTSGIIQTHWSPTPIYGDSANNQYGGTIIYKTNE